jgi:casein kinase 1
MEELIYTFVFLIKKSLPWNKIKAKNHVEKCKKMAIIKKNINPNELFFNCPDELSHIYNSIKKLSYKERPQYELYFIIFNNILHWFNIHDEEKENNFVKENLNKFLGLNKISYSKNAKQLLRKMIFKGYPLIIWYKS